MTVDWQGVFPASLTFFRDDYSLDLPAIARHLNVLVDAGARGVVMLGTLGENSSLEFSEKLEVVHAAVAAIVRRVPVLVGVAECSTALACRFSAAVSDLGADGLMVLPAMVYPSDPRETVAHFRAVAKASPLPIMCYNNPLAYTVDITPGMFAEMADEPRFVAIKESSADLRRITDIKNACGDRYRIFCGVDDLVLESVYLGAVGAVAGLVNAFPYENQLLWEAAIAGRREEALEIYRWYMPLLHLDTHVKLVQYIKLASAEAGLGSETVRPPRLPIIGREREDVLQIIRRAIKARSRGDSRGQAHFSA
jgi:4-hydroxy-tetrahydrodipicolinate synthase